jgi:4-amino-4-deoxy-L-arabinose transferase-like glycosyltransferase
MSNSGTVFEAPADSGRSAVAKRIAPRAVVGLAAVYWIFNVIWFWRYCRRNINADAISYIGIAHNITDGSFRASLHGYWSPLVSWLMAGTFFLSSDRTMAARLLMLPLFAACLILLYRLTDRLWRSKLLSAVAVLWFATARGISVFSVSFIGADFLLTAVLLVYFLQLLRCLEQAENSPRWFGLGAAHGVAFLTKAIAMPLLACATLVAVLWTVGGGWKRALRTSLLAGAIPALVWASWGMALHTKYSVFTTGYQLHFNLVAPELRAAQMRSGGLVQLRDTRAIYDRYMVSDVMPPGSPLWQVRVWRPSLLPQIVGRELRNVPLAAKEIFVLLTPGGLLALGMCVVHLTRERLDSPLRFHFAWIVVLTTAALAAAYCMLVFDGRYVIPVTPVLIAVALGAFSPSTRIDGPTRSGAETWFTASGWQTASALLLLISLVGVQVYWASPFRTLHQDFQESVYDGASVLKGAHAKTIIVMGEGPYPEHGVGWEAGLYSAYFAGARVTGDLSSLPSPDQEHSVIVDIATLDPDAVMVWGNQSDPKYSSTVKGILVGRPGSAERLIRDPKRGEVGTVVVLRNRSD